MVTASDGVRSVGVQRRLWLLAVLLFGVGDLASTAAGLSAGGAEANPLVGAAVARYELLVMVPLKVLVLCACYAVSRRASALYGAGVPIGLAGVGAAATGWNLAVLSVLLRA